MYRKFLTENFSKPFQNVAELQINCEISGKDVPKKLSPFITWFPNLHRLKLCLTSIDDTDVAVSFPHLKHLCVGCHAHGDERIFIPVQAEKLLSANQQLKSVEFRAHLLYADLLNAHLLNTQLFLKISLDEILDMISGNPLISKLSVSQQSIDVTTAELNRLICEYPLIEELSFGNYRFIKAADALMLIQQLHFLRKFSFVIKNREWDLVRYRLNKKWTNHIRTGPVASLIELSCKKRIRKNKITKLFK